MDAEFEKELWSDKDSRKSDEEEEKRENQLIKNRLYQVDLTKYEASEQGVLEDEQAVL